MGTKNEVVRPRPQDAAISAARGAVADDPALSRTSDTGVSDRSKDFGEPAPDGVRSTDDMLGEPQTNTGAFAGAVAGAVLGGAAGPLGAAAGAAIGGVVGGVAGAATVRDPNDQADDAGAAGDVADVDSDKDRVKRTYSGDVYEAGSPKDTARKDVI